MNLLISDRSELTIPKDFIDTAARYEFDSALTARESWRSANGREKN